MNFELIIWLNIFLNFSNRMETPKLLHHPVPTLTINTLLEVDLPFKLQIPHPPSVIAHDSVAKSSVAKSVAKSLSQAQCTSPPDYKYLPAIWKRGDVLCHWCRFRSPRGDRPHSRSRTL